MFVGSDLGYDVYFIHVPDIYIHLEYPTPGICLHHKHPQCIVRIWYTEHNILLLIDKTLEIKQLPMNSKDRQDNVTSSPF